MKKIFSLCLIFTSLATIFSCKKDSPVNSTSQVDPMADFYSSHKSPTQEFTVSGDNGGTIVAQGGTAFFFPGNSFADKNGNIISGNVTIKIDEFVTKADLIYNSISTCSNGKLLASGGAYKISVNQGSENLTMAPGKNYRAYFTSNYPNVDMSTYSGREITNSQYGKIDWDLVTTNDTPTTTVVIDSSTIGYILYPTGFNYINCDHPYDTLYSVLNIITPSTDHYISTTCTIRSSLSLAVLYPQNSQTKWDYAPLNKLLKLFTLDKKNDKLYISQIEIFFTGQQVNMPPFVEISEADLESFYQSL